MRTTLFLIAGFCLMAAAFIPGKLFHENFPASMTFATAAFAVLWLALTGFNLWTGVARAGYSVAEELPVFALLFGVPLIVAVILRWKFL